MAVLRGDNINPKLRALQLETLEVIAEGTQVGGRGWVLLIDFVPLHDLQGIIDHLCWDTDLPILKFWVRVWVSRYMERVTLTFLLVNAPKYRSACTPTTQEGILAAENALMTSRISRVPWPPELGVASPGVAKMVEGLYIIWLGGKIK
jgi:hypothetical protein